MAQEAGYKIGDDFFPVPDHFTLGDAVLVPLVSGLEFEDFAAQMDKDAETSAAAIIGLLAVSVAHTHPRWSRDRVVAYVSAVKWDQFEEIEGDELPPAQNGSASPSAEPSDESTHTPEPQPEDPA